MAPASFPSRTTSFLYTPRFLSTYSTSWSSSVTESRAPITVRSTPITFSFVEMREPAYVARGFLPERRSASTCACSQQGATKP